MKKARLTTGKRVRPQMWCQWFATVGLLALLLTPSARALPLYTSPVLSCGAVDITKTLHHETGWGHNPLSSSGSQDDYDFYYCECQISIFDSSATNLVLKDRADLQLDPSDVYSYRYPHHFEWYEGVYKQNGVMVWADSINYLLVTAVKANAFKGRTKLQHVRLPDTCRTIGTNAFNGCTALTSIELQKGLQSIGDYAFAKCTSLTSINLPEGLQSIGDYAFANCTSLTSINLPEGLRSIGDYAFANCTSLTNIVIPNSVTNIGYNAFSGCTALTSVTVPQCMCSDLAYNSFGVNRTLPDSPITHITIGNGVTTIGEEAFWCPGGLTSLKSVTIPASVTSIGPYSFAECDGLEAVYIHDLAAWCKISFEKGSNPLEWAHRLFVNGTEVTDLVIPDGTTSIGAYAFGHLSALTSVTIPDSVVNIGNFAFAECAALTTVAIPDSVTNIGDYAFCDCESMSSVTIPGSVASIGQFAFGWCNGLEAVHIHDLPAWCRISFEFNSNPIEYAHRLFVDGTEVTDLVIPEGTTSIGDYAFRNCTGLASVEIPASVASIGYAPFSGCSGIEQIRVAPGNPAYASADGVLFDKEMTTLLACPSRKTGAYVIPDSVSSIDDEAFANCSGLTSLTISAGVTDLGSMVVFFGCKGLASLQVAPGNPAYASADGVLFDKDMATLMFCPVGKRGAYALPSGVETIRSGAFDSCTGLTSVVISDGVTDIGGWTFYGCSSLTSATIPESVADIEWDVFQGCSSLQKLYVPASWEGTDKLDGVWLPDSCTVVYGGAPEPEETTSTPVAVPYSWLEAHASTILAEHANDYETAAKAPAANGRTVWECYVADISPADATDFKTTLIFKNGQWLPTPVPDRSSTRAYDIEGTDQLGPGAVWGPTNASSRFFRLRVRIPD